MRLMAPMDPLDKSSYVYETEESYYLQYAEAFYAPTMKKAGWDCLRHYEILSQWCLPYFRCFDQCPPTICAKLPRRELRLIQECMDYGGLLPSTLEDLYSNLIDRVIDMLRRDLTTEALASYVLSIVGVTRKETVCT
jgi:hypothetical protein